MEEEEELTELRDRLLEEVKYSVYPSDKTAIRNRYTDTSFLIFKASQAGHRASFLSFGSRRSSLVSSFGNTPTFMRRSFSSNGMLEYGVEQFGSSKFKEGHVLPAVTKEENEVETEDNLRDFVDKKKTGIEANLENCNYASSTGKLPNVNKTDKEFEVEKDNVCKSSNAEIFPKMKSIYHVGNISDNDENNHLKNRKFFHHYDMVPVKNPVPHMEVPKVSREDSVYPKVNEQTDICKENNLTTVSDINSNLETLIRSSNSDFQDDSEAVFPKLDESSIISSSSVSKEPVVHYDEMDSNSLPFFSESPLERSTSLNQKTDSSLSKNSLYRLSLKELPHRTPTPPKTGSKKMLKTLKDKDSNSIYEQKPLLKQKNAVSSSHHSSSEPKNSLPSLVSLKPESDESIIHKVDESSPLAETKPNFLQNLDDTPLVIVEENEVPSPRFGIQNLATDNKVNKSFIVVHPTSESNSLGLAPISSHSRKFSLESTTSLSSQRVLNGRKGSFSKSIENFSKHKLKSRKSGESGSPSYFSYKQDSSQIRLLKFTKSDEANFVTNKPVSPLKFSNYLVSKTCIRSLPLDVDLNLEGFEVDKFVETNHSRFCSIM